MAVLFLLALSVRMVAAVVVEVWLRAETGTPFLFGPLGDDYRYHVAAVTLARRWTLEGFDLPLILYTRGFETIIGVAYWVLSPSVYVGKAINVVAGALIAPVSHRFVRGLQGPRPAWIAGVLVALFPPLVFWSTVLYKDTVLTLAIMAVLVSGMRLRQSAMAVVPAVTMTVLAIAVVGALRLQSVLIVAVGLVSLGAVEFGARRWGWWHWATRFALPLGALVIVATIFSSSRFAVGGPGVWQYLGLERINVFYEARSAAFETSSAEVEGAFLSLPIQVVSSLVLPLPLFASLGSDWAQSEVVMLGGNFIWLWVLFHATLALWAGPRRDLVRWLPALAMIAGTSLGIAVRGYALIYRHKVQLYPFVIMLAAVALVHMGGVGGRLRRWLVLLYWGGVLVLVVVYNYMRVSLVLR